MQPQRFHGGRTNRARAVTTSLLILYISACTPASTSAKNVLYDYTRDISLGGVGGTFEIGQNIELDYPSILTGFSVSIGSGSVSGITDDLHIRLYRGVGLDATPAELLWSGVESNLNFRREIEVFSFDVPHVEVPRIFSWTVEPLRKNHSLLFRAAFPSSKSDNHGTAGAWVNMYQGRWLVQTRDVLAAKVSGYPIPEPPVSFTTYLGLLCLASFRLRFLSP